MLSVSIRSSVAGMSRIDFTPAQTMVIGVAASVTRSADSSNVVEAWWWTPPSPPVDNDADARRVGEVRRRRDRRAAAADRVAAAAGRSRTLTLRTSSVAEPLDLVGGQPDDGDPVDEPDRGRDDAGVTQLLLGLEGDLDVAGTRQPVGEDRRLQGEHRTAVRHRRRHLR